MAVYVIVKTSISALAISAFKIIFFIIYGIYRLKKKHSTVIESKLKISLPYGISLSLNLLLSDNVNFTLSKFCIN